MLRTPVGTIVSRSIVVRSQTRFWIIAFALSLVSQYATLPAFAAFEAAPFFPIHTGNAWTYVENGSFVTTTTVQSGTTTINSVATKALVASGDGFTGYYTNDANGIRLHRQVDPVDNITVTFSPPITLVNALTDVGQTVNSSGTVQSNLGTSSYTASFAVQAIENVTVPLRLFKNTVRLQGSFTIVGFGTVSLTVNLARNVGLVKITDSDGSETIIGELSATTVTPLIDFDADAVSDIGIYNSSTAGWSIIRSSSGFTYVPWGGAGWQAVPADYDGDGKSDIAVRNSSGLWSIRRSSDSGNTLFQWSAAAGDEVVQ